MTASSYPVDLQIERAEKSSRMWALFTLIGIKFIALIINFIMLYIFMIGVGFVFFVSQIIVLFNGKYPQGMHEFMVKVLRWQMQVSAFVFGLRDDFPPFAPSEAPSAVNLTIPYPATSSRGWAIMTMLSIKYLALVPQIIVLVFVMIAAEVVWVISQFAVLFTGAFPEGMHRFIVGALRWSTRVSAFMYGLCDQYPPFSLGGYAPPMAPPPPAGQRYVPPTPGPAAPPPSLVQPLTPPLTPPPAQTAPPMAPPPAEPAPPESPTPPPPPPVA